MDKNEFLMESRRMKALAWVHSWMNGYITDWAKVVAFANVGDFNGFEDEIKLQADCYYPSEQSRAWFHALRLVTNEDVEEFLSLGVQSPAPDESENARMRNALLDIEDDAHTKSVLGLPLNVRSILMSARHGLGIDSELLHPESVADEKDENGLLPCPFCGGKANAFEFEGDMCQRELGVGCRPCGVQVTTYHTKYIRKTEIVDAWNARAHAPNAGKDLRSVLMAKRAAFRRLFAYQAKLWGNRVEFEKAKSENLIEALEWVDDAFVFTFESGMEAIVPQFPQMGAETLLRLRTALAAYNGKEGGA